MMVKPLLVIALALGGSGLSALACEPAQDAAVVRLARVDGYGDARLADGRVLRLAGLAPRRDAAEAARFADAIELRREREFRLVPRGEPDRWGRLPARLFSETAGGWADLAAELLAAGAAARWPEAGDPCDTVSVAAAPALDGHDLAALRGQAGRMVTLSGRIASVGERAQRTYLNFSRRRGEAAAIMLSRGLWRDMQREGHTAKSLVGRTLRAHGVLAGRDGLLLDVSGRTAIELQP